MHNSWAFEGFVTEMRNFNSRGHLQFEPFDCGMQPQA
jgi:hypothetical protein